MPEEHFVVNRHKTVAILCRIILGIIFLVFGLDGFVHFLPQLTPSAKGGAFLSALMNSGYFYQFLKGMEVCCGVFIVANAFVPLFLLILTPIIVNILLYGIFLDPRTLYIPFILLLCAGYLFWYYRDLFKIFLKYQYYTPPDTEGKAKIIILEERKSLS